MIKSVIRTPNDMVMVFDENGEQLTEYQGHYAQVKARILKDARPSTIFGHWVDFQTDITTVSKDEW